MPNKNRLNSKNNKKKSKLTIPRKSKVNSSKSINKKIAFKRLNRKNKILLKKKLISRMLRDKDTNKFFLDMFFTLSKNNIEMHYENGKIVYKTVR